MHLNGKEKMQWAVLAVSAFILTLTVIAGLFDHSLDTTPSFWLFATVAGFVFGASIINKLKQ